ncbi:MAG: SpoIIE family protein phosphatase [Marinilabiliaceae bacterium]|nr:SpoIIE family protein phosphatase [Marinilabiliaceae bacterium]
MLVAVVLSFVGALEPVAAQQDEASSSNKKQLSELCYSAIDSAIVYYMNNNLRGSERWSNMAMRAVCDSTTYFTSHSINIALKAQMGISFEGRELLESALTYFDHAEELQKKRGAYIAQTVLAYLDMLECRQRAVQLFRKAGEMAQNAGDEIITLYCSYMQAESFIRSDMYSNAAQKAREVAIRSDQMNVKDIYFFSMVQLFRIYSLLCSNDMADSYMRDIDRVGYYRTKPHLEVFYLQSKVDYLIQQKRFEEAMGLSVQLLNLSELISAPAKLWKCYIQRAKLMALVGNVQESELYLNKCKEISYASHEFKQSDRYSDDFIPLIKAMNCVTLKHYEQAKSILESMSVPQGMMRRFDFVELYYDCYEGVYVGLKQYNKACEVINKRVLTADTIATTHTKIRQDDLSSIFQTDTTILRQKSLLYESGANVMVVSNRLVLLTIVAVFLIVVIVIISFMVARRRHKADEQLNISIQKQLQEEVSRHTETLRKQNEQISQKNTDIIRSQNYAKRIQQGLLPTREKLQDDGWFSHAFIIYRPYEITSGDFYWYTKLGNRIIICSADGSGHGIPGAMMSMVGLTLVNEVVRRFGDRLTAGELLEKMHEQLKRMMPTLHARDGIDMTVCVYNTDTMMLNVSSASQSLVVVKGGEAIVIHGTKRHIGEDVEQFALRAFSDREVQMDKGDVLYLYTDGLTSLINGETMQKLKLSGLLEIIKTTMTMNPVDRQNNIRQQLNMWKGSSVQADDILLMVITV